MSYNMTYASQSPVKTYMCNINLYKRDSLITSIINMYLKDKYTKSKACNHIYSQPWSLYTFMLLQ